MKVDDVGGWQLKLMSGNFSFGFGMITTFVRVVESLS